MGFGLLGSRGDCCVLKTFGAPAEGRGGCGQRRGYPVGLGWQRRGASGDACCAMTEVVMA